MRVVIISDFGAVNGGAAKVAIESARGLAEAGVEIVFACAIDPVSERLNHPLITVERFSGQEVWQIAGKVAAARRGIWNTDAHAFLTRLLALQPRSETLVHLHQWTKAFSPAAIAAAAQSGLPVAITMHDYFSFCPTGGYFDFKAGRPCTRRPMSGACMSANCDRESYVHKLVRVARQWRSDEALRLLKEPLFIHVSRFAKEFAEGFLPRQSRHVVIENMMEADKAAPADVAANRHALFLGRFTQEKGVLLLAEAAREAGMPLRLVGQGDAGIEAEIARLNPEAVMAGWVSAAEVVRELRAARCLVAPSLWYETGPLTAMEAMAQGVPPIVTSTMGAAGQVEHGRTGFVIPAADRSALASSLAALRDDRLAGELGHAAYEAAWRQPLTLERHVSRLLDAFGQQLAQAA